MLFEISYKSPDDEAGNFEPKHLVDSIQRQHYLMSDEPSNHDIDDEQQTLLDIEQNIANFEKNLNQGTKHPFKNTANNTFGRELILSYLLWLDVEPTRHQRRNRKRDLLKRVMSSSHHRSNTIDVSDSKRNATALNKDTKSTVSENMMFSLGKKFHVLMYVMK